MVRLAVAKKERGSIWQHVESDREGTFKIRGLAENTTYWLSGGSREQGYVLAYHAIKAGTRDVELVLGPPMR